MTVAEKVAIGAPLGVLFVLGKAIVAFGNRTKRGGK